jgi:hypothetical protein
MSTVHSFDSRVSRLLLILPGSLRFAVSESAADEGVQGLPDSVAFTGFDCPPLIARELVVEDRVPGGRRHDRRR